MEDSPGDKKNVTDLENTIYKEMLKELFCINKKKKKDEKKKERKNHLEETWEHSFNTWKGFIGSMTPTVLLQMPSADLTKSKRIKVCYQ